MPNKTNGKQKGNSFERKIANRLSERFATALGVTNGFRRNSDSGSFFGGGNQTRTQTYNLDYAVFGDLICPANFRYVIECKHYKTSPSWQSFIDGNVKQWDQWLAQNDQDAASAGKPGVLIVKYNNVSELAFVEQAVDGVAPAFVYKKRSVYRFEQWLEQTDSVFFL